MASLRIMFLVITLSSIIISDTTIGADHNEDRIGTILSYMVQMKDDMKLLSQKVDGVQEEVKDVSRIEELTSDHLLKVEDKVADVIDKQEKMGSQVSFVNNQVSEVKNKVEKIERDAFVALALSRWRFIGIGVQGSRDEQVIKNGFTLGQCIEYCQKYRESAGTVWNGLVYQASTSYCWCDKNSRGIRTSGWDEFVLYRVE